MSDNQVGSMRDILQKGLQGDEREGDTGWSEDQAADSYSYLYS